MNSLIRRSFILSVLSAMLLLSIALPVRAQDNRRIDQGAAFLDANNIPPEAYVELSAYSTDPTMIAQTLVKYGFTPEQAQGFLTPENVMALRNSLNPGPADDVVNRALALLGPYNLNLNDLGTLLPKLNDPQAVIAELMQKGLTQEQAMQVLQDAAPLIQEAGSTGLLQYAVLNEQVAAALNQAGFNSYNLYSMTSIMNDPDAVAAQLQAQGYSAEQIQAFQNVLTNLAAQGVTQDTLEGFTIKSALYRLEGMGLSAETINDIVAMGDLDSIRAYLEAQGFSGNTLELAMVNMEGVIGTDGEILNEEKLDEFQTREAAALLEGAGIDPADLGDLLALRDDPEALSAYLAENYAMTPEQIAAFEAGLNNSTFAQTVDPEDADDFASEVEMSLEEGDDYSSDDYAGDDYADDYADDYESDDYADDYADEYASDDYADDYAGDDYADEYASEDYAGDESADDYAGEGDTGSDDASGDEYNDEG